MQLRLIQRLVALMKKGDVTELELEDSQAGLRVRLKRGPDAPPPGIPVVHLSPSSAAPLAPTVSPVAAAPSAAAAPAVVGVPFPSPMVGTFYRSSSPDAEPFVKVGSNHGPDSTVCIIEAMKVMNEIKAETSGQVLQLLVQNGEPVEFGQPLFLIQPA
jgi:acetyl-CoA carboxylase biotin carboxyl carrier protein